MTEPIQAYEPIRQIDKDLFVLDGDWYDTPLRRRMTIVRLPNQDLLVHSPIRLNDGDYAQIEKLGAVRYLVAPNTFHCSEIHHYVARYNEAKVYVAEGLEEKLRKTCRVDGQLPLVWPPELAEHVEVLDIKGLRLLRECAFFHRATATLILTDLAFNMQTEVNGGTRAFFKWNQIYKRFGPSRIFRWVFANNKVDLTQSVNALMAWPFRRVIVNHGTIFEGDGRRALHSEFSKFLNLRPLKKGDTP